MIKQPHEEVLIMEKGNFVSLREGAAWADVSEMTIRRRIADGTIQAYRVGRLIKIEKSELDKLFVPTQGA